MASHERIMKTCDACRTRKVRCVGAGHQGATSCIHCARRGVRCHFSALPRPRRNSPGGKSAPESDGFDGLQSLYVDRLLTDPKAGDTRTPTNRISLQGLGVFGNEYSLSFFSQERLASLATRLGHEEVRRLVERVAGLLSDRFKATERVPTMPTESERREVFGTDKDRVILYVKSYFEHVHPIYSFLDRQDFESKISNPGFSQTLATDKPWAALFYTVLTLGCQYHDGGSYNPGQNIGWRYFSTALSIFPDLLISKATLSIVQAITAMAIYASNISCMQFEYMLITEGVKKAQILGYNRSTAPGSDIRNRTFWVLYCIEKTMSFTVGRSSTIMDLDISTAVAPRLLPELDDFDWNIAFIRHARLLSRIYASLYSVSAGGRPIEYYRITVSRLRAELEAWRVCIPEHLRPKEPIQPHLIRTRQAMDVCIRLHYLYYNTMLTLNRTVLQLESINSHEENDLESPSASTINSSTTAGDALSEFMLTSRSILELTRHIAVEPYTSLWVLAAVPLAAHFILFSLAIDYPEHPQTPLNLAMLDIGSGHFSRIEYSSGGTLPGSIAAEFAHIARRYVQETTERALDHDVVRTGVTQTPIWPLLSPTSDQNYGSGTTTNQRNTEPMGLEAILPHNSSEFPFPDISGVNGAFNHNGTDFIDLFGSFLPPWDDSWSSPML